MEPWYVRLSRELKAAKAFADERVTPRALSCRYHAGRAVSVLSAGECEGSTVVGYAALWKMSCGEWYELEMMKRPQASADRALLWVRLPEILSGLGNKRAFLISDDEAFLEAASKHGFSVVNRHSMPDVLAWASQLHVVRKIPSTVHGEDIPVPGDGLTWLLVR